MLTDDFIKVGEIRGVFGVKGWLKVFSFTQPRENILEYASWTIQRDSQRQLINVVQGRCHGKLIIVALKGVNDRDEAEKFCGWDIFISRNQLPDTAENEYYWADLIGLHVKTVQGVALGVIDHLIETGANDVLVVTDGKRERLIPFLQQQTVIAIDLENQLLVVDWDPEF